MDNEYIIDMIMDNTYPTYKKGEKILNQILDEKCNIKSEKRSILIDEEKEKDSKYSSYFQSMMKKFGIQSIKGLEADKKKKFFDAVDKGWKAKKETD